MNKQGRMAVAAWGATRHSLFHRLPALAAEVGPVMAASFGAARKISKALKAGWAARSWVECADSKLWLLYGHERQLPAVVQLMAWSGDWTGKTVAVWGSASGRDVLFPLAAKGALTASIVAVEGVDRLYVMEAHPRTALLWKKLLRKAGARVLALGQDGQKAWRRAAEATENALLILLEHNVRTLRESGMDSGTAHRLTAHEFHQVIRRFSRGARAAGSHQEFLERLLRMLADYSLTLGGRRSRRARAG